MTHRNLHVLVAALTLASCAAGPRYKSVDGIPEGVPEAKAVATSEFTTRDSVVGEAPADRWWAAFQDATLDSLIDEALADNPDLAAAEARVQQSRAEARIAGAALHPAVNADARVSRDKLSRNGENLALIPFTPPTTEFTDYRLGFDASWEIDLAGKTRHDVESAVAHLEGRVESRHDARSVIAADVAGAYVDYRSSALRLDLAQQASSDLDDTARLVTLEQRAGTVAESDLSRTQADRQSAAAQVTVWIAERQAALFHLAALTGATVAALDARLGTLHDIPAVPTTAPVGLPADLLRRRPDVRHAERDLAAATADEGSAVAAQFPRLSLVGDLGWDSVRVGDLTNAASRYWNLAPQLTIPLFAGGKLRAQVKAATAARDAALATYRATVLRALADAETSIARFAGERRRQDALSAAATALERSLALERRRYSSGEASRLEVLSADRQALAAEDQHAASRAALAHDYVAMGKALGGGWQTASDRAARRPVNERPTSPSSNDR